jgi:cytochrome c oxidase assembly factor CtaG
VNAWNFDLSALAFLAALTCFYAVGFVRDQTAIPSRGKESWLGCPARDVRDSSAAAPRKDIIAGDRSRFSLSRGVAATIGVASLAIALTSPLDALGDRGVFVAHMAQHLLLLLVAPVFLLAGAPESMISAVRAGVTPRVGNLAASLPAFLLLSVGAVWIWHAPRLFDLALRVASLHLLEHATFLSTAVLFWWPVVRPDDFRQRVPELALLIYLFAAAVACSMLGALIALGGVPVYSGPAAAEVGLTPLQDQQLGGILMWGFGGLWYFGVAGVVFARWFVSSAAREECSND